MLESAVARILNQLLGKYVVDLDTENLNVGIFSGHVQLTDLKLKIEALYELKLPIKVSAGTIGKVQLQIPWSSLWSQPVIVNIEDIHIIANPIVGNEKFDADNNKRLLRAFKRKILTDLNSESDLIGGPGSFSEYLVTNVINNLQLNISNVHLRYEDDSEDNPLVAGFCIGSITAEATNGKWKACVQSSRNLPTSYYLIKMEAFSIYCNPNNKIKKWNLPSQYYEWRNAMSSSLQNYSMHGEDFQFLIRPMTTKIKLTINRNKQRRIDKLSSEIVVHDFNVLLTKEQSYAIRSIYDKLTRMLVSWELLEFRPVVGLKGNAKVWWKYAYQALLKQRIKPYTWSAIKLVRENQRIYCDTYKKVLLNPNDTELKLDLQKYEDKLGIFNIVIARQQAKLEVLAASLSEKSFWDILPTPERQSLCEKIGFQEKSKDVIEYCYNFRIGNTNVTLINNSREILVLTMTQLISSYQPNFVQSTYKVSLKIEGIILEGASQEDHLVPIISSDHNGYNSPAYFLKFEIEKVCNENATYRVNFVLEYLELVYHKYAFDEIQNYFQKEISLESTLGSTKKYLSKLYRDLRQKLLSNWDFNLDIKLPFLVIPENGAMLSCENILIVDLGQIKVNTELTEVCETPENVTQMELEELMYSRYRFDCSGTQVLFCNNGDTWHESRKEKDTDLHILSKTSFNATHAVCIKNIRTLPKHKINLNFPTFKLNLSERNMSRFLKFLNTFESVAKNFKPSSKNPIFKTDQVTGKLSTRYLLHVQNSIILVDTFIRNKRNKDKNLLLGNKKKKSTETHQNENMDEVWARCVDLPGLEDNISPNNTINNILRVVINEFQIIFSRSSDSTDRQYLSLRLGVFTTDIAWMTYGPAYQLSLGSIIVTDKLHTTSSGQYLDLIYSPFPPTVDVLTILYRKVAANCPDFWTHFHGVETSLVADFGTLHIMFHQEAFHTIIMYTKYMKEKLLKRVSPKMIENYKKLVEFGKSLFPVAIKETPVPPGSVKFSHSARLENVNVRICDSDFDIVSLHVSGLEVDFLFRANERFVLRAFLSKINVEHLSDVTLYPKILYTDEDKVFDFKYVRYSSSLKKMDDFSPSVEELNNNGSFKFNLGQLHVIFLYKLVVQLHRFMINLEAMPYLHKFCESLKSVASTATDTLMSTSKIHLAINIKGPVLLVPQKSSSPNVIIVDTGDLIVENFFKDYQNEVIENILIKLNDITMLRGIMTLTSILEMQETIIEPINLSLDIKRFISLNKSFNKSLKWDIDGVMDTIPITLGQKDLGIILSVYSDNIGEGQLLDLFPIIATSPLINGDADENVKNLEAFFCEPKQKDINVKFNFESIKLSLFFDSGELLSSPIRDLNHGLCKFEINDIVASFVVYTDKSIDGKLSVTNLAIEEIGPDANAYHKGILQSPCDESKNNNCNITVNKPPIVDITFHQNKTSDKSIDIIIGCLALSLSIPFCEKLAMFIIECMPKENIDAGFINHGYIGELTGERLETKAPTTSLTVALRVNRPEFIFFVETASKRKRYFITKAEILSDYSRHANCENFVISLSGLQTLFCDVGISSCDPYTILKHCDVELSKTYSEEKGTKITALISSIYVQFCNKVVYSINDILNDVIEHFKVPEDLPPKEVRSASNKQSLDVEDMWEATKINESIIKTEDAKFCKVSQHEIFLLPKTEVVIIFELEEVPVIVIKTTLELNIYDWSSLLNSTCEMTLQANYFNETNQTWEPIVDPVVLDEHIYKPWEVFIKVFQDKAQVILSVDGKIKKERVKKSSVSQSTTEDEDESGDDMIYLKPTNNYHNRNNRRVKTSLSTFLDDSDSENEDGSIEKLAAAISDLFTGDWNESDGSECEQSSEGDDDSDDVSKIKSQDQSLLSQIADYKKATYILIDAKDVLHLTITPAFLKVLNDVFTMYSNKTISIVPYKKSIILINDIGPKSKVELFETNEECAESVLIVSKTYEKEDSCPNSPTKFVDGFIDDAYDDNSMTDDQIHQDVELGYDFETINSLEFAVKTTPQLYKKETKQVLKIHVPGFKEVHTGCPKKAMQKLLHLHSISSLQTYYLVTKCLVNKYGRTVVLSSPLQIKNETCFALSILYQPSVLQQLNLEPIGDVTNPFETTMRIAVLEPHEQYNVPLYIAYHCKLFIQPAYAEGHYASNKGIWWRDLVTDLDTAHNFHCNPKSNSKLEVFSLRVLLRKNVEVQNSHAHSIPNYVIHLLPPLILYNFLPYTITVENRELNQQMKVEPGEKTSVYSLNLSVDQKLVIKMSYNSYNWSGTLTFTPHLDDKVVFLISESNNISRQLAINVKAERDDSCNVYFYTPYWIVNKTGLPLQIKSSSTSTIYAADNEEIILFTYKRHGKQTLQLKVYDSDWSSEFGLDCAGTTGLVVCKDNERKKRYPFLLSIKLTEICPRLTQLIMLLPSFIVSNNTNRKLRFMEHNERTDLWIDLAPKQNTPFWPETSSMKVYVKFRDSKIISQPFFISTHHHTVLRMDKGTAIIVNVTGGRTEPFKIVFEVYKSGDAPIYVKNMCADLFLKIQQQGQSPVSLLSPFNAMMYTWDDPTKSRNIIWNIYNNKGPGFSVDIHKEGFGEEKVNFHSVSQSASNTVTMSSSEDSDSSDSIKTALNNKVRRDKIIIYWIVYREGKQKTLLFTQDQRIFNGVLQNTFGETCDFEFLLSLAGVGLSCFTTISSRKEHVYFSINDLPATWEVNVGHKWKTLTLELASWIEDKYRLHYKKCQLKDYIHIDFEKMFLLKPFFAELRRTYNPAVYAHLRKSRIHKCLDVKVQSLQIDNNFAESNESVLLYPLPIDDIKSTPPFIDLSVIKTNTNDFDIYKNISLMIGDFYVNVQNDLLVQLSNLLVENRKFPDTSVLYRNDMNSIHSPIFTFPKEESTRTIVENVYLSETSIQLNILRKAQCSGNNLIYPINNLVCFFFPHNISPYMPIEGVKHKITPLDMADLRLNFFEVMNEIKNHFSIQLLQQYYAQVLGLQVLVNPFSIQAVSSEKPANVSEKISSAVLYGCRCLLGHVNMSSIALEQSVIEVFSNQNIENIQRIRRHTLYHNQSTLPKSVLSSAKKFNPGVILAMQQIIAKTQNAGLHFDGELFFRGTGKALVSILTRHPDEKTDCVQVSIEALKRAVILGEPIKIQQRLARYCNGYLGLRPYSSYESMGFHLLETVANGRFLKNNYWAHAAIEQQGKSIIIISLENVIRINKCRLWGPWELEWCLDLDDIISVPKVTTSVMVFNIRQNESEILNSDGKLNIAGDKEVLEWLQEKIQQAIVVSMEDKSWNPNKSV